VEYGGLPPFSTAGDMEYGGLTPFSTAQVQVLVIKSRVVPPHSTEPATQGRVSGCISQLYAAGPESIRSMRFLTTKT